MKHCPGGIAMKRFCHLSGSVAAVLILAPLFFTPSVRSQSPEPLDVEDAVICQNVADRKAVNPDTSFPASVGKVYCYNKILGAKTKTHVTHVWYYGNVERARITLPVKASRWRTHSSKKIRPQEIGVWHVDILGPAGERLEVLNFHILRD